MRIGFPQIQEIQFDNGRRLLLHNVTRIEQGNMTHITAFDGKEYIINPNRVLFIKVYPTDKTDYEVKE
jgi:hypothetical protein